MIEGLENGEFYNARESFAALEFDYKYYDIESNEIEESEDIE